VSMEGGSYSNLMFSENGSLLAGENGGVVSIWDTGTGRIVQKIDNEQLEILWFVFVLEDQYLAVYSRNSVVLWDVESGVMFRRYGKPELEIEEIGFSAGDEILGLRMSDGTFDMFLLEKGLELESPDLPSDEIQEFVFSPVGQILAVRYDRMIVLWDTVAKSMKVLEGHTDTITHATFSPDGQYLASGSDDGTVRIWDIDQAEQIGFQPNHEAAIQQMKFSSEGKLLVTVGADARARLFNIEQGKELYSFSHPASCCSLYFITETIFLQDGKTLLTAGRGGRIKLWDTTSGEELNEILMSSTGANVWSMGFLEDSQQVVTAFTYSGDSVYLLDPLEGSITQRLAHYSDSMWDIEISGDGNLLAAVERVGTAEIWSTSSRSLEQTMLRNHRGGVNGVAFSPDETLLVSGSSDGTVRLWFLSSGKEARTLEGFGDSVNGITFSHDGRFLLVGTGDKKVTVLNVNRDYEHQQDWTFPEAVYSVAVSRDGKLVAVGLANGTTTWSTFPYISDWTEYSFGPDSILQVEFSPAGLLLTRDSEGRIRIIDPATGEIQVEHQMEDEYVYDAVYSPDGSLLVITCGEGWLKIIDTRTGEEIFSQKGHASAVMGAAFNPEGTRLYTGSWDGTLGIWGIRPW